MRVLVDTCVWSLALRRSRTGPSEPPSSEAVQALAELVREGRVAMIGPIRQELLSGVRGAAQFRRLADSLAAFPDEQLGSDDYVEAARCFNRCRASGVQGSSTDLLICAVSLRRNLSILTTDGDFSRYATVLGVRVDLRLS